MSQHGHGLTPVERLTETDAGGAPFDVLAEVVDVGPAPLTCDECGQRIGDQVAANPVTGRVCCSTECFFARLDRG